MLPQPPAVLRFPSSLLRPSVPETAPASARPQPFVLGVTRGREEGELGKGSGPAASALGAAHWTVGSREVTRQPRGDLFLPRSRYRPAREAERGGRRVSGSGAARHLFDGSRGRPAGRGHARGIPVPAEGRSAPGQAEQPQPEPLPPPSVIDPHTPGAATCRWSCLGPDGTRAVAEVPAAACRLRAPSRSAGAPSNAAAAALRSGLRSVQCSVRPARSLAASSGAAGTGAAARELRPATRAAGGVARDQGGGSQPRRASAGRVPSLSCGESEA